MTTFALLHGAGDGGWAWGLVRDALRERGHEAVAPDLPTDRDDVTWEACADTVARAVGTDSDVVVVGQSAGGFVVPLVAQRLGARLQVYVAGLVPSPDETAEEWFDSVGWLDAVGQAADADGGLTGSEDVMVAYYHDVPADLAAEAVARERRVTDALGSVPLPLAELPSIPSRYVVTARDRFLPPAARRPAARGGDAARDQRARRDRRRALPAPEPACRARPSPGGVRRPGVVDHAAGLTAPGRCASMTSC